MNRNYRLYDTETVSEAMREKARTIRSLQRAGEPIDPVCELLDHAAQMLRYDRDTVVRLSARVRELEAMLVGLGCGFDRRGLDGDPKEPKPCRQERVQGSWVDEGSHA